MASIVGYAQSLTVRYEEACVIKVDQELRWELLEPSCESLESLNG